MNWLDVAIVVTVAAGGYLGWHLGLVRAASAVAGVAAGVVLAQQQAYQLEPYLSELMPNQDVVTIVSFLAVVVGAFVASVAVGWVVRRLVRLIFLGWLDGTAGVAVGMALLLGLWAVGLSVVGPLVERQWPGTVTGSQLGTTLRDYTPGLLAYSPEWMEPYLSSEISAFHTPWALLVSR